MNEMNHHLFGPSSLRRRELCPGSARLEKDLPESPTSPDAAEGTRLHAEIAEMIEDWKSGKPIAEPEEPVLKAFDFFKKTIEPLGDACEIHAEYKLEYSYAGIVVYFGTADVLIVSADSVTVIDWKFGHREVNDAPDNIQLAAYALAAMRKFGKSSATVAVFNPVIYQQSSYTFTEPDKLASHIMGVIAKCKEPNAPCCASEEACRYCRAAEHGTCPAIAKTMAIIAEQSQAISCEDEAVAALEMMTDDQLSELKDKCQVVDRFHKYLTGEIGKRAEANGDCAGYHWKESSGGREIKDINKAFSVVSDCLSASDFLSVCSVSVTNLEKLYSKTLKDSGEVKTQKDGKLRFAENLADLISEKTPRRSLVK